MTSTSTSARLGRAVTHVTLPLLVGGWLYIGGRTTALLMWDWGRAIGVEPIMVALREATVGVTAELPDWVLFSLPDALWVYALTYAIVQLQRRSSRPVRLSYLMVPLAFGPGAELMQAAGWLPGTFDPVDLVLCLGALGLGWLAAKRGRFFETPPQLARHTTMKSLSLLLAFTCAFSVSASAQNNADGAYRVLGPSTDDASGTITVRRGSGRPPSTVRVGTRIRATQAWVRSTDNANQHFQLHVWSRRTPECGEAFLRLGADALLSESHGHDPQNCTASFMLTPAQASRAARVFGVVRQDRTPVGERLRGVFRPSASRVSAGADVQVILTISNPSDAPRVFRYRGGRNRGPRNNRFSFTIERDGQPVTPIEAFDFGGLASFVAVGPGESGEVHANLSRWGNISTPGRYVVRCAYETNLSATGDLDAVHPVWERRFEGEVRFTVR